MTIESVDYIMKFIIVGDSGVGKSCLTQMFLGKEFNENT